MSTLQLIYKDNIFMLIKLLQSIDGSIESLSHTINRMGKIVHLYTNGVMTNTQKLMKPSNIQQVYSQGNGISTFISPSGVYNIDQLPDPVRNSVNNDLNAASKTVGDVIKELDFTNTKIDLSRVSQHLKENTIKPWSHIVPYKQVAVDVFFEGLCADSRAFIKGQLAVYFPLFEQYIDLTLIPFGKAKSTEQGFQCQHGPNECKANMIMSCVLSMLPPGRQQVSFTDCYMTNPLQSGLLQECTSAVGISQNEIDKCVQSSTGIDLQLEAEQRTRMFTPGPTFVPTVIFNKRYDESNQQEVQAKKFVHVLCKYLPTAPPCL